MYLLNLQLPTLQANIIVQYEIAAAAACGKITIKGFCNLNTL